MPSTSPADTPPDEPEQAEAAMPEATVPEAAAPDATAPETAAPIDATVRAAPANDLSPAACGARLAELFPALFVAPGAPGPMKPIKLRIHADIQARAPGVFSKRVLGIFFSRYTTTNAYLKALAAPGAQRFDLDGQGAGEIAEEHRLAATEELARRHTIAAERRAAQRQAAPRGMNEQPSPAGAPRAARADEAARRERPRHERERERPQRPQRPPRHDPRPERRPERRPEPAPVDAVALPIDPAQRERALLLRSFEASPLSKANFCALKRISETELDAALAQARLERQASPSMRRG